MSNRTFLFLAILAIALGGALGGLLIVALDNTSDEPLPIASIPSPGGTGDVPGLERLSELAQRVEGGDASSEDVEQLGELVSQFPGASAAGAPLVGGTDASMIGTVQALEGNSLALNTPVGPLQATLGDDTTISSIAESEGTLADLTSGLRVTLTGERNTEGLLEATSVRVIPEGLQIPQRGQFAGQLEPGMLAGLAGLSEQERSVLAMQAAIMAAAARSGGNVTVESPEEGVTVITAGDEPPDGPIAGGLAIPSRTEAFSFQVPSQDGGAAADSALTGVLESVTDGVLDLTTPRGPVRASITQDTAITIFSETGGTRQDLTSGVQVLLSGQPDESGSFQATSIAIIPESLAIPVGGPFGGRGGFGGGQGGFGGGIGGLGGGQGGGRPGEDR